jgi:hypothetical protein
MQFFEKGKPRAALSARDDASLARKPGRNAVSATIISDQQAALRVARLGAVLDAFLLGGAVATGVGAGAWQAFAARDFDKSTVNYGLLGLAILLAVTAYIVNSRRAAWPAKLSARSIGLPPAGSDVSADEAGLTIASRTWLWSELEIDEVHIVSRSAGDGSTSRQIERLVFTAAGAPARARHVFDARRPAGRRRRLPSRAESGIATKFVRGAQVRALL